ARHDREHVCGAESFLLGYRFRVRRAAEFTYVFSSTFGQPKRPPYRITFEQNMTERMADIIGNIVRRFVLCDDKQPLRTTEQIRGLVHAFFRSHLWRVQRIRLTLSSGLRLHSWQGFKEIGFVFKEKNLDGKLPGWNRAKCLRKGRDASLEVRNEPPAFHLVRVGKE